MILSMIGQGGHLRIAVLTGHLEGRDTVLLDGCVQKAGLPLICGPFGDNPIFAALRTLRPLEGSRE